MNKQNHNMKIKNKLDLMIKLSFAFLLIGIWLTIINLPFHLLMLTLSTILLASSTLLKTIFIIPKEKPDWTLSFPELTGIVSVTENSMNEMMEIIKNNEIVNNSVTTEFPEIKGFARFCHFSLGLTKVVFILTIPFLFCNWAGTEYLIMTSSLLIAIGFIIKSSNLPHEFYSWELVFPELSEAGDDKISGYELFSYKTKILCAIISFISLYFWLMKAEFAESAFLTGVISTTLIFIVNAFNLPNKKPKWDLVFPQLNN